MYSNDAPMPTRVCSQAAEMLPQCQVVILSATTLLNRTVDDLLDLCRNARELAILGPSTPLLRVARCQ